MESERTGTICEKKETVNKLRYGSVILK